MKSIRILMICSILFIGVSVVNAQPGRGGDRGEAQILQLKEKVGLTSDQEKKVREIMTKSREEMRKDFENSDGDRESMRAKMMERTKKNDEAIAKLLTKEQLPKFKAYQEERRKMMEERMRNRE
jgi:Spy/CpxP family protein refolding chaperone